MIPRELEKPLRQACRESPRIRSPSDLRTHAQRGSIFESFVLSELMKASLNRRQEPDLYFWRDARGREVDLLVERGSRLVPVEVKSGTTVAADFFEGLEFWMSLAAPDSADTPAALVYGGRSSFRRRGILVCSWAGL